MSVIEDLGKLQEDFFKKSGDLYKNMELLGKQLYDLMLADIVKTYEKEAKRLMRKAKIEYEKASYKLDCEEDTYLPGRCGFLWLRRNEPADLIFREVWAQAREDFNRRTEALEKLEAALDKASENARPFDEPQEQDNNPAEPVTEQNEQDKPKETPEKSEPPQDEKKLAENGEKQEPNQTDKPAKPEPDNEAQPVQSDKPDTATTSPLTAQKEAVKPQTRTESTKASEQIQKEEKISTS